MFKKMIIITTLIVALLSWSTTTLAAQPAEKGVYIEANGGIASISGGPNGIDTALNHLLPYQSDAFSSRMGTNITAGYKFMKNFAIETGYTTFRGGFFNNGNSSVTDVAAKGILPLQGGVAIFAKLGVASIQLSTPEFFNDNKQTSGSGTLLGFGMSYAFTPHVSVNIQTFQVQGSGDTAKINFASTGIGYNFG